MRSLLPALLLAAACTTGGGSPGPGAPATCKLDDVLAAELDGHAPKSCGSLAPDSSTAAFQAARTCVLAAIEASEPFVVVWDIQGIDSRVARAFYGLRGDSGLAISSLSYDGDPRGGGGEARPRTTTSSCSSLAPVASCDDTQLPLSLCLSCATATVVDECSTP
ncbi:MAG: hypothetical protein JNL83_11705 [Myxococcales bacterium]|nr:hypothetical protein [Myxococcales bacterium]